MPYSVERIGTLRINNGAAISALLSSLLSRGQMKVLGSVEQLSIQAPAALTNAVAVEVAAEYPGVTWSRLKRAGVDVTLPAGGTTDIDRPAFRDLRFQSAANEGANRDFVVIAKMNLPEG